MSVDQNNNLDDVEQLMQVDSAIDAGKENNAAILNSLHANSQELLEQVDKQNIVVKDKKTNQVVDI